MRAPRPAALEEDPGKVYVIQGHQLFPHSAQYPFLWTEWGTSGFSKQREWKCPLGLSSDARLS